MALSNHERVGKALDLLRAGLRPFVEREMKAMYSGAWKNKVDEILAGTKPQGKKKNTLKDVAAQLVVMDREWGRVFSRTLGKAERSLVNELQDFRNRWAHQEAFSGEDADRALDSASRLLKSISAPEAAEVEKLKLDLRRQMYDKQAHDEKRRRTEIKSGADADLTPWRDVITPHPDVAGGRYQQAEFAADLWQVHRGEGSEDYLKPVDFFHRTHVTESLKEMLTDAVRRLKGEGGQPVIQLQTNFGGGKTHAMLALYHLFSGERPARLPGIDEILKPLDVTELPEVRRVVLVGNRISPSSIPEKEDGTRVRTLWGELAWQLGGAEAYARIKEDDANATNPGDALRSLLNDYAPCLVLIDEWVAYARQLHDESDLPGGSFETQFTFAQTLTEAAKGVRNCLLVLSLPASDSAEVASDSDDAEVGGERGREALGRLANVVGRVARSWSPASATESFEIVRRRLFEPLDGHQFKNRDAVAKVFSAFYRDKKQDFPPECAEADYERRIQAAYPIHPEVFDRLYEDWSTLVKFQRTRGVLRLMASVVHNLWEGGSKDPLILPAHVPIDDGGIQSELTRYLSDNWRPIIDSDVDGNNSLPARQDREDTRFGKYSASRRVARTIYMGSAPKLKSSNPGIEERRIKLGCALPGESPAIFGDALRRLAGSATHLYQDGARFWYSIQPTVNKLAADRAEQLRESPEDVAAEIGERLRKNLKNTGDFSRVHLLPPSSRDVPDERDARLVVLRMQDAYLKGGDSAAEKEAQSIMDTRGDAQRVFRNTLVFLAADQNRFQDLEDAARRYLAWESILNDRESLNLDPSQVKQAEDQRKASKQMVEARIPETYRWLLTPFQGKADERFEWRITQLSGQGELAERAGKKLKSEDMLVARLAASMLRKKIDEVPLWRDGDECVEVRQLAEDFARYLYLPRLRNPAVLVNAVKEGIESLSWSTETFAFADEYDEGEERFVGLIAGKNAPDIDADGPGLLVKAERAARQLREEEVATTPPFGTGSNPQSGTDPGQPPGPIPDPGTPQPPPGPQPEALPKRFYGTVKLDPTRAGADAGRITEEVIAHLQGLLDADVKVTLEIEARVPGGIPDDVKRTVSENSTSLKFDQHGFEEE